MSSQHTHLLPPSDSRRAATVRSAPRRKPLSKRRQWSGLIFLAPALILFLIFIVYPMGQTIDLSLWKWDGTNAATAVGFRNYADVFSNPLLRDSIVHALILIIFFSLLPVTIGLIMAALLARGKRRGMGVYRMIFFLPQVLPMVAMAFMWQWMYNPNGVINQILGWFGIHATTGWLGSWNWALPAVGLIGTWVQSGLMMMLFFSGIGAIEPELFEAVRLDGAGVFREFFTITLPGLRSQISMALTITVISALASFDLIYVGTGGGPYYRTTVPSLLVYQDLTSNDIGHAAALAIVLTVTVLLAALVVSRISRDRDRDEA